MYSLKENHVSLKKAHPPSVEETDGFLGFKRCHDITNRDKFSWIFFVVENKKAHTLQQFMYSKKHVAQVHIVPRTTVDSPAISTSKRWKTHTQPQTQTPRNPNPKPTVFVLKTTNSASRRVRSSTNGMMNDVSFWCHIPLHKDGMMVVSSIALRCVSPTDSRWICGCRFFPLEVQPATNFL